MLRGFGRLGARCSRQFRAQRDQRPTESVVSHCTQAEAAVLLQLSSIYSCANRCYFADRAARELQLHAKPVDTSGHVCGARTPTGRKFSLLRYSFLRRQVPAPVGRHCPSGRCNHFALRYVVNALSSSRNDVEDNVM
jgi:hypothetical protein